MTRRNCEGQDRSVRDVSPPNHFPRLGGRPLTQGPRESQERKGVGRVSAVLWSCGLTNGVSTIEGEGGARADGFRPHGARVLGVSAKVGPVRARGSAPPDLLGPAFADSIHGAYSRNSSAQSDPWTSFPLSRPAVRLLDFRDPPLEVRGHRFPPRTGEVARAHRNGPFPAPSTPRASRLFPCTRILNTGSY